MQVSEPVKKQFVEYVMLQVFDDQYMDRQEEKKILEEGIRKGISVQEGLSIIRQLASEKDFVIEREAEERIEEVLRQFALNDGVVDKKEFEDALALFNSACKGKVPEPELKKRLKKMMLDKGWKAKEGTFFKKSKWFSAI
ncbi:hypothetical protein [Candidatus Parabeggiatoa sp. HSG14]|uniref:hypothetical protein n=1 Tax=Candidatus Parabeggiatoa sp. HSG14 TaxID=3055593 RepID=UPI0025A84D60|nr:hypothetical protein [Thiotrichales bacterium HSG14]